MLEELEDAKRSSKRRKSKYCRNMRAERKNASRLMDSEHQVCGKVENKTGYDKI